MMVEPASCCQAVPSSFAQSPLRATPAITVVDPGFAETIVRFPHSEAIPARLPLTFTQVDGGVGTAGPASGVFGGPLSAGAPASRKTSAGRASAAISMPPPPADPAEPPPPDPPAAGGSSTAAGSGA